MNLLLTKNYIAGLAVLAYRLVKFGSVEGTVVQATSSAAPFVGVSGEIGADVTYVERIDIHEKGICNVTYGGVVTQGDPLTSDANGKAIKAEPVTGTVVYIAGFARTSGILNDVGEMSIAPAIIINPEMVVVAEKTITSAQLLALHGTPIEIIPAPGANKAILLKKAIAYMPFNSVAYDGVAGGEDLVLAYTNGSGTALAKFETTGFIDQGTSQVRVAAPEAPVAGTNLTPTVGAAVVAALLSGEIATGNSTLKIRAYYVIIDTAWA